MGEPSNTKGNRKSTATYFDTNDSTFDNTNAWEPSPEVGIAVAVNRKKADDKMLM